MYLRRYFEGKHYEDVVLFLPRYILDPSEVFFFAPLNAWYKEEFLRSQIEDLKTKFRKVTRLDTQEKREEY